MKEQLKCQPSHLNPAELVQVEHIRVLQLNFVKMSGAGNDFVVADNHGGQFRPESAIVTRICDRRFGVGADGLLLVEPSGR
jgi:hypothetical protein